MRRCARGIAGLLILSVALSMVAAAECSGKPVKFRVAVKSPPYKGKGGRPVRWFHIAIDPKDSSQERLVRLACQLDRKLGRKDATLEVLIFTSYEIARRYRPPGTESELSYREQETPLVAWYERDDKTGENDLSYYPDPLNKLGKVRLNLTELCRCPHRH